MRNGRVSVSLSPPLAAAYSGPNGVSAPGLAQTSATWHDGDPLHAGGERLETIVEHRAPQVRCQAGHWSGRKTARPGQPGDITGPRSCISSSTETDGTRRSTGPGR